MSLFETPVYPIPPFFNKSGALSVNAIKSYVDYLKSNGVKAFMTTVGTSGYNLLNDDEILLLNDTVDSYISSTDSFIVGLPIKPIRLMDGYLTRVNIQGENRYFMAVYPDRYYHDNDIANYFYRLTTICDNVFVHGLHIRKGIGGGYHDYNDSLIQAILKRCEGVVGMKEETSSLMPAEGMISAAVDERPDFEIVVAGGSCKRFMYTKQFGATNFLSGLGSLFPEYDNAFFESIKSDDNYSILEEFVHKEKLLFDFTKRAGWHTSMRESISYILDFDYHVRDPFPRLLYDDRRDLETLIEELRP